MPQQPVPEGVIGLYLHVPPRQSLRSSNASAFVRAVTREMERYARPPFTNAPVRTLYIGGEPSLLPPSTLSVLIDACRQTFGATAMEEATLELHPATTSPSDLRRLRLLGITRLSINGGSFVDDELQTIGALPSENELRRTIRQSREAGFERLSVDLSFGGPDQSLSGWKTSLQRAVELRLPHMTLCERDSADASQRNAEERADCFAFAMTFLDAKGYEQYELTHFARPGHRSTYQEHVYAHGPVLGLGPGAESFWGPNHPDNTTAQRWSNVEDPDAYVEHLRRGAVPVARRETLHGLALAREYVLLRLRTNGGLNLHVLETRYGVDLRSRRSSVLDRLREENLIEDDPEFVRLTDRGRLRTDAITRRLLPS